MAKFSTRKVGQSIRNLAGGRAYALDPKTELVTHLLTSFMRDQYYRTEDEGAARLRGLLDSVEPEFAAKTAIFARTEFGMRSVSHFTAAAIAGKLSRAPWAKHFYNAIVHRVDDMTEIAAAYLVMNPGKDLPNAMKKGFQQAFNKFDAYQLAKYRGGGRSVSLIDLVRLVHPKPTTDNAEALRALVKGTLKSTDTWEARLSAAGEDEDVDAAKGEAWADLVRSRKIGYFALLRNLRNILDQAPGCVDDACALLTDEKLIRKSLVLPFRFSTAYDELRSLKGSAKVIKAISKAIDIAVSNVPAMPGQTLVVLDVSGSMCGRPAQIGSMFAAALAKRCEADLILFSDTAKYMNVDPRSSTLAFAESIRFSSGGTNFESIFTIAKGPYDRIFVLSDMQGWMESGPMDKAFRDWCKRYACEPFLYSFDLQGYGTSKFPVNRIYLMSGFSEKVFELIPLLETDRAALVNRIEAVPL